MHGGLSICGRDIKFIYQRITHCLLSIPLQYTYLHLKVIKFFIVILCCPGSWGNYIRWVKSNKRQVYNNPVAKPPEASEFLM